MKYLLCFILLSCAGLNSEQDFLDQSLIQKEVLPFERDAVTQALTRVGSLGFGKYQVSAYPLTSNLSESESLKTCFKVNIKAFRDDELKDPRRWRVYGLTLDKKPLDFFWQQVEQQGSTPTQFYFGEAKTYQSHGLTCTYAQVNLQEGVSLVIEPYESPTLLFDSTKLTWSFNHEQSLKQNPKKPYRDW